MMCVCVCVCAGLWNQIFFLSNLALFILMPFAYFFTEAEGFSGSKKVSAAFSHSLQAGMEREQKPESLVSMIT